MPQLMLDVFAIEEKVALTIFDSIGIMFFMFNQCELDSNQKMFKIVRVFCYIQKSSDYVSVDRTKASACYPLKQQEQPCLSGVQLHKYPSLKSLRVASLARFFLGARAEWEKKTYDKHDVQLGQCNYRTKIEKFFGHPAL